MPEYYPLEDVSVGTIFQNGQFQLTNCINKPITKSKPNEIKSTSMSGESKFMKSEMMNRGSLGVSGSYGVSGIAKFSFAVSGYYGQTSAKAGKEVNLNYSVIAVSDKEYLNINELKISDLIAGMSSNCRDSLLTVLDNFNTLNKTLRESGHSVENILSNEELFNKWNRSLERFFRDFGDGFVVAVQWGAFGYVNLNLTSTQTGLAQTYGGEISGEYNGLGGGTSVKLAYAGSQTADDSNIHIEVKSNSNGKYVDDIVSEWRKAVEHDSFSKISDQNLMATKIDPPKDMKAKTPEFEKPKPDGGIMDKLKGIKDVEGLEVFAKAHAYKKAAIAYAKKNKGKELTLEEFNIQESNRAEIAQLIEAETDMDNVIDNLDDMLDRAMENLNQMEGAPENNIEQETMMKEAPIDPKVESKVASSDKPEGFTAISALVVNWSDLFPWLARGYFNSIGGNHEAKMILQWRTLIQDAQALSTMYFSAHAFGLNLNNDVSPDSLGIAFSTMTGTLQDIDNKNPNYAEVIIEAYRGLNSMQKTILQTWANNGFLRSAELGLGYVSYEDNKPMSIKSIKTNRPHPKLPERTILETAPCYFEVESQNFNEFSTYIKLYPLIQPDGKITAFNSKGHYGTYYYEDPNGKESREGFHNKVKDEITVHIPDKSPYDINGRFWVMPWQINKKMKHLYIDNIVNTPYRAERKPGYTAKLYPIPFSAANRNAHWRGGASGAVSLSSFKDMMENIESLRKELSKKKAITYSSDSYDVEIYEPDQPLTSIHIKEHYIGILPEEDNPFKLFSR